jgi:hypothetical protein
MAKGEGSVIRYNKKTGVVIEGFDDLTEDNLDVLSAISHANDKDNKRAYFRKKKSAKSKSKRKTKKDCGCK